MRLTPRMAEGALLRAAYSHNASSKRSNTPVSCYQNDHLHDPLVAPPPSACHGTHERLLAVDLQLGSGVVLTLSAERSLRQIRGPQTSITQADPLNSNDQMC